MSTRNVQQHTDAEPTADQSTSRPDATTQTPARMTRPTGARVTTSAAARAPRTFSHGRTDRLQNLIDRWNTAFAGSKADTRA